MNEQKQNVAAAPDDSEMGESVISRFAVMFFIVTLILVSIFSSL